MNRKAAANEATGRRHGVLVRYLGSALSGVTGILYLLIGLGVMGVGDNRGRILLAAAIVFFILAAILPVWRNRSVLALAAAIQVVCIVGYFVIAPSRTPHFEAWGIIIKVLQVMLLAVLGYTIARSVQGRSSRAVM